MPYVTLWILLILDVLVSKEIYLYLSNTSTYTPTDTYYIYIIFFLNLLFWLTSIIRLFFIKKYVNFEQNLKSWIIATQEYLGTVFKIEKILSWDEDDSVERFFLLINIEIDWHIKQYKSDWYSAWLDSLEFDKKISIYVNIGDKVKVFVNMDNINEYYIEDLTQRFSSLHKNLESSF